MKELTLPLYGLLCLLLLSGFTSFAQSSTPIPSVFKTASLSEIQAQASSTSTPYLLFFTANWIMPCQWMEENTFQDPQLTAFINSNCIAGRVVVDQAEGQALQEQYAITSLPSVLVFNSRGQLIGQQEGASEAPLLLDWLKNCTRQLPSRPQHAIATNQPAEAEILSSPKPVLRLSRPALIPTLVNHQSAPAPAVTPPSTSTTIPRPHGFFSIQVGVFSSYESTIKTIKQLRQASNLEVFFLKDDKKTSTLYRIYIGKYREKYAAQLELQKIKSMGIDGFVKKIDI
jgi:cell division septation protein DedD